MGLIILKNLPIPLSGAGLTIKGHFSPINRNDGFFHQELERIEHIFQHVDFQ